jgi:RHS repeat-associated protein
MNLNIIIQWTNSMNPIRFLIILVMGMAVLSANAQTCSTCGGINSGKTGGGDTGPSIHMSLGNAQYGQPAGNLIFSSGRPDPTLFTPAALQYDFSTRTDVNLVTTNEVIALYSTNYLQDISVTITATTNTFYLTSGGITYTNITITNVTYSTSAVTNTDLISTNITTNAVILQVQAPQAIADVPTPPTANGYAVNFYYPTNVSGTNLDGTFQFTGGPFISWVITNTSSTAFQLQVSEYGINPSNGLMKQWTYSFATNTGSWSLQTLGGLQESVATNNLGGGFYQITNIIADAYGNVARQVVNTYEVMAWSTTTNVVLVTNTVGIGPSAQTTTYSYWDPAIAGTVTTLNLPMTVTHPDGSSEYYDSYDANGNPLVVYSSFQDDADGRERDYTYDPTTVASGSGDDGTQSPTTPRKVVEKIEGSPTSVRYTVFPSAGVRLDIQCLDPSASWNTSGNLVTTNIFYTNGPNQFALEFMVRPDGTVSAYNYITNGSYQTNITVTGQPDSTGTNIVDGVSNVVVLNYFGYTVSSASYDVASGYTLSHDIYGNFDSFDRPQQVTHLDGTTEYMQYSCCGMESFIDRDGLSTVYLYDPDQRQIGYTKIYSSGTNNAISYENNLDAVGHAVQSFRVGSDSSVITMSQSAYDTAGELVLQTNALNGVTTYTRTNATTGGLVRTTVYPNGGVVTNFYYTDGTLKKVIGTAVHGKAYGYGAGDDDLGNTCTYAVETNLDASGILTSEWTKTFTDMVGRTTEIYFADGHYSKSYYNGSGQLSKQVDPDGVVTLYQYNGKGELAYTAIDLNQNNAIDFTGSDHITQTTNDVTTDNGTIVRRTRTYVWLDGSSTGTLVSVSENSTNGLDSWQTQYRDSGVAVTNHIHTVTGTVRTVTTTAPDGSYTVNTNNYGRLIGTSRRDPSNNQIGGTIYGYDVHGRQNILTDARDGTTTLSFNNADLVVTNTSPNPGGGSPEVTITTYNNMMQATSVLQPDATTIYSVWLLTGELGLQYGSRTYPVGYSYDYAGRMQTMTNWSNYSGGTGARVTTWNYSSQRGFLTGKTYADGNGPSYSYTGAGRLASRTWMRGITTSYAYDTTGSLTNIAYNDGVTPGVTNSYDRLGRLNSVFDNGMTDALTYNLANELLSESYSGGGLNGLSVTNIYDQYLRRTNLTAWASGILNKAIYGYDNASRLSTVSDGTNNATYTYLANSPLVSQIVFKQNSTARMTTTKSYDFLNRLTQISSAPSASYTSPLTFNYNYNPANQRTKDTLADGSYWIYGYDSLGQVTNACKYFADGTPVAGQQFDYAFDTIGNRTQTLAGGDATGANLRVANYSANNLNQITSRDVPPYVDVMGASILTNAVTVNGNTAYRKEEYYRQQLPANNTNSALWTNIVVSGGQSVTGNVYVAQEPEQFSYDSDGNLTNDGRWAYTWDGENRLKVMMVNTNVGPQYQLTFAYDAKGRRIQKIVETNGVALSTNNFLYDGWNLIAETRPNNSLIRSYVWGTDLSGTSQGAGGVGGLLEISYYGSSTTNCFPAYDGNGNIMALVNAADGTVAANYDYAAFGEPIRITGVMARNNPFRFSTKYADDESDLLYYGYRYYKASTGTWFSRDPIDEEGGLNLYGFSYNDPIDSVDSIGQYSLFGIDLKPCYSYNVTATWTVKVLRNLTIWPGRYSDADVIKAVNAELNKTFPMSGDSGKECQCNSKLNFIHIDLPLNITKDQTEYVIVKVRVFLNLHIVADVWICCGK